MSPDKDEFRFLPALANRHMIPRSLKLDYSTTVREWNQ
jgi:hypothetical protein